MSIKKQIDDAEKNLAALKKDNIEKISIEEMNLTNAKFDLSTLDYLKIEANIETNRAIRNYVIERAKERLENLKFQYDLHISNLKELTASAQEKRDKAFLDNFTKSFKDYQASKIGQFPYYQVFNQKNMGFITYGVSMYSHYLGKWETGRGYYDTSDPGYNQENYLIPLQKVHSATSTTNSGVHQTDNYTNYFGVPISSFFKYFEIARKNTLTPTKLMKIKNNSFSRVENVGLSAFNKKAGILKYFNSQSIADKLYIYDLVDYFYPPVNKFLNNPELYSNAVGFMEETPWPTTKQLNQAYKDLLGVGTHEWGKKQVDFLTRVAEYNTKDTSGEYAWTQTSPDKKEYFETHMKIHALPNGYYDTQKQEIVEIPFTNFAPTDKVDPSLDPANKYYAPRPKEGFIYVPYYDYINPLEFVPNDTRDRVVLTPKGEYLKAVSEAEAAQRKQERLARKQMFMSRISALASGGFSSFMFNPGGFVEALGCAAYGEDSGLCKTMKDVTSFSRGVVRTWVAGAVAYATGGAGASIGAVVSTAATDPALGIAKTDLGRVLVALAEAYAIANVTNTAVETAMGEVLENQIYGIAKREIGKATGLDRTFLGRVGLDLSTGAAFNMYKGMGAESALLGSADKSWRLSVARENPYGAILMAGITEVEKNGWSIDSNNPTDWFNNISLGEEFTRIRRTIRGKDMAKIIGLTYMVSAGKISEGDAFLMIGQEASKRNLEKFYNDQPIQEDPEMKAYREKKAEVDRWKLGISVLKKLERGETPTKEDVLIITDNVAGPIYDRVKSLGLPTNVEVNLWQIAINDVGLPNLAQYTPDVSFTIPDWMKSSKSDGHVTITDEDNMTNFLNRKFTDKSEFTREDLVQIILNLWPRNVPLVPIATGPQEPSFNFIDEFGKMNIRDPLKFPFDHPMLTAGQVKKRYTPTQRKYMLDREAELKQARAQLAIIQQKLAETGSSINLA